MQNINRGNIFGASLLIGFGVLILIFNIAGIPLAQTWPILFFALGAVFFLPPLIWPSQRSGLAGLCIPGTILLTLGGIFLYNVLSGDWPIWAFAWLLILAGVGLGIAIAAWMGRWGGGVSGVGWWMFISSVLIFSLFAALFGSKGVNYVAPVALIIFGLGLIVRTLRR